MKLGNLSLILIFVFLVMLIFSACSIDNVTNKFVGDGFSGTLGSGSFSGSVMLNNTSMLEFESISDLNNYLARSNGGGSSGNYEFSDFVVSPMSFGESVNSGVALSKSVSASMDRFDGASDYSSTNVQYDSVDEADFIKNDDKYIYQILDNELFIIDVFSRKIVSTLKLSGRNDYYYTVKNILLSGDSLVVLRTEYEQYSKFSKYEVIPYNSQKTVSFADFYDISDRKKVSKVRSVKLSGSYDTARLIGDTVYFISSEYVDRNDIFVPFVEINGVVSSPKISYFPNLYDSSYKYNLVVSMDINSGKVIDKKTLLLGYSDTLMVNLDGIYIAYHNNYYCRSCRDVDREIRFYNVIFPLLPDYIQKDINSVVKGSDSDLWWSSVSKILDSYYTEIGMYDVLSKGGNYYINFDDLDKSSLTKDQLVIYNIRQALIDYDLNKSLERDKTNIVRIEIDNGTFGNVYYGSVNGKLLNQFSMDSDGSYLRVATNVNVWANKHIQYSNVYVLDNFLKPVGSLEHLAENESIYSVRFMGDKLYLVTYEQVDPFFVIDLSDVSFPKVLGTLKIPGYSSYLHPLSDDLILGIGKDTYENKWGGISTGGIKVSLFNVSDFENPVEISKLVFGKSGSYTSVQNDHKAFTVIKSRNEFVLPIRIRNNKFNYNYESWIGSYVISYADGNLKLKKKLKSTEVFKVNNYRYYNSDVVRSLYFDNLLVTVSKSKLDFWNMNNDYKLMDVVNLIDDNYTDYDEEVVFDEGVIVV